MNLTTIWILVNCGSNDDLHQTGHQRGSEWVFKEIIAIRIKKIGGGTQKSTGLLLKSKTKKWRRHKGTKSTKVKLKKIKIKDRESLVKRQVKSLQELVCKVGN